MSLSTIRGLTLLTGLLSLGLVAGCGGAEEGNDAADRDLTSSGNEETDEPNDGAQITGLMGTIRPDQVENTMHPRMDRFQRCFTTRMGAVEVLAGTIRLGFRIHTDGTVAWVYPQETDIGDRRTERCILETAARARFPRPRGGEAEFTWGFGLDASPDIRPPNNWQADALGDLADDVPEIARDCRARGEYTITAYIRPGGEVLAAGGSMPNAEGEEALDCILGRVESWEMPDPGSYAAKITFGVQ